VVAEPVTATLPPTKVLATTGGAWELTTGGVVMFRPWHDSRAREVTRDVGGLAFSGGRVLTGQVRAADRNIVIEQFSGDDASPLGRCDPVSLPAEEDSADPGQGVDGAPDPSSPTENAARPSSTNVVTEATR
jgi:hypothetical protein